MRLRFLAAWRERHEGTRIWLTLLSLGWALACLWPFPHSPAYDALGVLPHLAWSLLGLLGAVALFVTRPGRTRMLAAAYIALFWAVISLGVTFGNQVISTGTVTYGLLAIIAFDYLFGGAR